MAKRIVRNSSRLQPADHLVHKDNFRVCIWYDEDQIVYHQCGTALMEFNKRKEVAEKDISDMLHIKKVAKTNAWNHKGVKKKPVACEVKVAAVNNTL